MAARATTPTRVVSATGSAGIGFFAMTGQYVRATQSNSRVAAGGSSIAVPSVASTTSSSELSVAPGLLFGGGVLIGSNPGVKLYLGLLLAIEFAPDDSRVRRVDTTLGTDATGQPNPYGTPALDIAHGTQVHFGPVLAVSIRLLSAASARRNSVTIERSRILDQNGARKNRYAPSPPETRP